jgi:septation ring formation regulator EzrA
MKTKNLKEAEKFLDIYEEHLKNATHELDHFGMKKMNPKYAIVANTKQELTAYINMCHRRVEDYSAQVQKFKDEELEAREHLDELGDLGEWLTNDNL